MLGISDDDAKQLEDVDHFFHLAAIYDMSADEESNRRSNVEGTKNAVDLANRLRARHLHHVSSIAVSGRYRGFFREDMFDEGQKLADPYSQTKFESEKLVRERAQVPWRVYRPGIVVGHSQTGEMDKVDGPYYFFKVIQRLRSVLPPWMPTIGLEGGKINIVPVDYVAAAMDHIAHQDGLDGQAFHLTDPNPKSAGQVIIVVRARRARTRGDDAHRSPDDERGAEAGAQDDRPAATGEAHHGPAARGLRDPARGAVVHRLPERLRQP